MSIFTVNPTGTDPVRWAGQMALALSAYGNVPILLDPDKWRDWAATVVGFPAVAAVNAPRPQAFATWEDWAHQFNLSLRLIG